MIKTTFMRLAGSLVFALCVLASCGGETGTNPPVSPDPDSSDSTRCSEMVTVLVSSGTTPTISWTPDCAIGRLIVEEGIEERWGSETGGDNVYRSPIVYDVHPPQALELEPAIPLVAGNTYTVSLFAWISVSPESLQLVGTKTFTP